jgi:probable HAF family extracellular repeat protein
MACNNRISRLLAVCVSICSAAHASVATAVEFIPLGYLAGGTASESISTGVSANGLVAVGYSSSSSGYQVFLWTQAGGMMGLGDLAGGLFSSSASGVSADGSVVVGWGMNPDGNIEAWLASGMTPVPLPAAMALWLRHAWIGLHCPQATSHLSVKNKMILILS